MKLRLIAPIATIAALSMSAGPAWSAGADDGKPLNCMALMTIDHTEVVDNQNILFYMRNDDVYLNRLSHPVDGLDRNRPFLHQTSTGQICRGDIITVLEDWGFGFTAGASSTFGNFEPIDAASADTLLGR
jgi:hypothetical protein